MASEETPESLSPETDGQQIGHTQSGQARPRPLAPGLYIVATPIGNARDITLRALDVLASADAILCEDSRVTGKLLQMHGVKNSLLPYHDHNAAGQRPKILERLKDGKALALVSDAGTPMINDPGYKLVEACREEDIMVTSLPGASSVTTALTLAGLPTDRFLYAGFPPVKSGARQSFFADLADIPATLVFLESPRRLAKCFADMMLVFAGRQAAVCRELTKLHEETRRGRVEDLADWYNNHDAPKGEAVIVLGPPVETGDEEGPDLEALLARAMEDHSLKDAVKLVTEATGLRRKEVYQVALSMDRPS